MSTSPQTCKGRKRIAVKLSLLALTIAGFLSGPFVQAGDNNPFDGYSSYSNSYFLDYSSGSFDAGASGDVQVNASIGGTSHSFNVDTGSRGLYAASTELGGIYTDPVANFPTAYAGEIQLTSSHRVSSGYWVPTTVSFNVRDQNGASKTVASSVNILAVTTLGAQMGNTANFTLNKDVVDAHNVTEVYLIGGNNTVPVTWEAGVPKVYLSRNATVNQQISYSDPANPAGLIKPGSNFGIGFDLGGSAGGTGPVANNMNQIYNPLINVEGMVGGNRTLVAGYIVEKNGIQLGLTGNNTDYGYTTLNTTGLTSDNSQPDWQTPMGQTVVHDGNSTVSNGPGSIVMDSGISKAYLSDTGLTGQEVTKMEVYLMNSGGMVGYKIDLNESVTTNPSKIDLVLPGTDGTYSQSLPPYQPYFFNTGRNVFTKFNMLYDAENGYMGLYPNSPGWETDPYLFFQAQSGGFPNPIPEGRPTIMVLMGLLLLLLPRLRLARFF
ncbi:MAG: hypothetical protein ACOYM3_17440 [Terrimicrobiaceae bacterium]